MSINRLKTQLPALQVLCKCKAKVRKDILRKGSNDLIKCICECSLNMLNGNISISKTHKNKLKRYKRILRLISDKKRGVNSKKKIIVQSGGSFLLSLIPAAISTIISLLSK